MSIRDWPEPHTELLREKQAGGFSASQIAALLNARFKTHYSRSAIIGKIHRLGLGRDRATIVFDAKRAARSLGRKASAERRAQRAQAKAKAAPKLAPHFADEALPAEDAPPAKLFQLIDMEAHQCRWPYGDPKRAGFGFCGCAVFPGKPYCPEHVKRSAAPPVARRRPVAPVTYARVRQFEPTA